jgi:heat shock protein HslJ
MIDIRGRRRAFVLLLAALSAGGPGLAQSQVAADLRSEFASFQDRELQLVRFVANGRDIVIPARATITLTFQSGGQISGHSAVNNYAGSFRVAPDGKITIQLTAATQMAGAPELMQLEREYFEVLPRVTHFIVKSDQMILEDEKSSLEFVRNKS